MDTLKLAKKLAVLARIYALGLLNEDEYTRAKNKIMQEHGVAGEVEVIKAAGGNGGRIRGIIELMKQAFHKFSESCPKILPSRRSANLCFAVFHRCDIIINNIKRRNAKTIKKFSAEALYEPEKS